MEIPAISIFIGLALALFLPGFPLALALYPKKGLEQSERLMLSVLLSISAGIISTYALSSFFRLAISPLNLFLVSALISAASIAVYLIRLRSLPAIYLETHEYNIGNMLRMLSVASLMLLNSLLAYGPHIGYAYPLSGEEWGAVSQAMESVRGGSYASGLPILLAEVYMYAGQDLVSFYSILPALFAAVTALGVYVFVNRMTGSYNAGLLSMLLLPALLPNQAYLTPMTLSYAFIFFALYLTSSGFITGDKAKILPLIMIFLALALTSPLSLLVTLTPVIAYVLARPALVQRNPVHASGIFLALILTSVPLIAGLVEGRAQSSQQASNAALFSLGYVAAFILSIAAAIQVIRSKRQEEEILPTWFLTTIAFFLAGRLFGLVLPMDYLMLPAAALAGIGLYRLLLHLSMSTKRQSMALIASMALISLAASPIYSAYRAPAVDAQASIDDETYEGLRWLSYRGSIEDTLFSRNQIKPAYFAAKKSPSDASAEDVYRFFVSTDCEEKEGIASRYNVTYILMNQGQYLDCEAFQEIYYQEGVYIYLVR